LKGITFRDIQELNISPLTCYRWAEEMIRNKDQVLLPPKISLKPFESAFCNVMPSIVREGEYVWAGVKLVTRYPNRVPSIDSQLLLLDGMTGEYCALMDATWITAMRTGAVAAHSVQLLAKKDFSTIGMIGLGNTARAALAILVELYPNRELNIKLQRYKGQEELFVQRFADKKNLHFSFADDPDSVVKGSEVVLSGVTYQGTDMCRDESFDEGVLVVPIHTRGFGNCDLFFDKVYGDDYGHICGFKYFDKFKQFAEVADVVNGRASGRESDTERILAYNVGVSMHDVYFAAQIYKMIKDDRKLMDIDMCFPTEKFWV